MLPQDQQEMQEMAHTSCFSLGFSWGCTCRLPTPDEVKEIYHSEEYLKNRSAATIP